MTRKELQTALRKLGFNNVCLDDDKTLVAYAHIQYFLKSNRTPIKAITSVYVENGLLRVVLCHNIDLETDYSLNDELDDDYFNY